MSGTVPGVVVIGGLPVVGLDKRARVSGCCGCGGVTPPPTRRPYSRCVACQAGYAGPPVWVRWPPGEPRRCVMASFVPVANGPERCFTCRWDFGEADTLPSGAIELPAGEIRGVNITDCCNCPGTGCGRSVPGTGNDFRLARWQNGIGWVRDGPLWTASCCCVLAARVAYGYTMESTAAWCYDPDRTRAPAPVRVRQVFVRTAEQVNAGQPGSVTTTVEAGGWLVEDGFAQASDTATVSSTNFFTELRCPPRGEIAGFPSLANVLASCARNAPVVPANGTGTEVRDCLSSVLRLDLANQASTFLRIFRPGMPTFAPWAPPVSGFVRLAQWAQHGHVPQVTSCGGGCEGLGVNQTTVAAPGTLVTGGNPMDLM